MQAFQDFYPENVAHCYGCGRLNGHGHQIKTYWEGDESVTRFRPQPYHTAIPGFVYGGLLASLIDCHGTGTAAAAISTARSDPTAPTTPSGPPSVEVAITPPTSASAAGSEAPRVLPLPKPVGKPPSQGKTPPKPSGANVDPLDMGRK